MKRPPLVDTGIYLVLAIVLAILIVVFAKLHGR